MVLIIIFIKRSSHEPFFWQSKLTRTTQKARVRPTHRVGPFVLKTDKDSGRQVRRQTNEIKEQQC